MGRSRLPLGSTVAMDKESPVRKEAARRRKRDRQRMTRETRAGRECHVSMIVPKVRIMRRGVSIWMLGIVSRSHSGVIKRIRMKSVVNAGRVVAEVGVRWVERKSVRRRKGSRRRLHLVVNSRRVSTISSRDL